MSELIIFCVWFPVVLFIASIIFYFSIKIKVSNYVNAMMSLRGSIQNEREDITRREIYVSYWRGQNDLAIQFNEFIYKEFNGIIDPDRAREIILSSNATEIKLENAKSEIFDMNLSLINLENDYKKLRELKSY